MLAVVVALVILVILEVALVVLADQVAVVLVHRDRELPEPQILAVAVAVLMEVAEPVLSLSLTTINTMI